MIKIICVGKLKEKYLIDMINDYYNRIKKYVKIEIIEIKDTNIEEESKIILNKTKNDYIILLDRLGKEYSSLDLKDKILSLQNYSRKDISFVIGSSMGVSEKVKTISDEIISFSHLTFPHGLFRAILLEQIYRSFKLINNETYHK
jgi:23S rRNA (pseudouridine1915-N3)-methyltransferase